MSDERIIGGFGRPFFGGFGGLATGALLTPGYGYGYPYPYYPYDMYGYVYQVY
ncbi:hypothetical protein [Ectobacillus polymachus]|uniref:hypothetical protein n=1 Tax=Ectobacillus polymachus TaxID=1508806 RepID=UPI003A85680D